MRQSVLSINLSTLLSKEAIFDPFQEESFESKHRKYSYFPHTAMIVNRHSSRAGDEMGWNCVEGENLTADHQEDRWPRSLLVSIRAIGVLLLNWTSGGYSATAAAGAAAVVFDDDGAPSGTKIKSLLEKFSYFLWVWFGRLRSFAKRSPTPTTVATWSDRSHRQLLRRTGNGATRLKKAERRGGKVRSSRKSELFGGAMSVDEVVDLLLLSGEFEFVSSRARVPLRCRASV